MIDSSTVKPVALFCCKCPFTVDSPTLTDETHPFSDRTYISYSSDGNLSMHPIVVSTLGRHSKAYRNKSSTDAASSLFSKSTQSQLGANKQLKYYPLSIDWLVLYPFDSSQRLVLLGILAYFDRDRY